MNKQYKKTVHLICNAHIDPIWQWDFQEGISAVLSTFRAAASLAQDYDYIFCHNEVTVYKYVEQYAPILFEKIKKLVAEGKWHITGGWYLQPDCNMLSGESFVRQIKTGALYFKKKFGVTPKTGFNVDAFGHSRGIVQIMKKCGQDSLIVVRPYPYELKLENNLFWWEGFDGSKIKTLRSPNSYNTPLGDAASAIRDRIAAGKDDELCILWGVGNHGGGPSRKDLADIKQLAEGEPNYDIVHSTPDKYFDGIAPKETVSQSLRISMPGCYTSMSNVKQKHIQLENELYLTEIMCSVAALKGLMTYPENELNGVCEDMMTAEFHDVLPGSCVKAGEENGLGLLYHGYLDAVNLKTKAFFALCRQEKIAEPGELPIIVFNPNPYPVKDNLSCEFMLPDQNWSETEKYFVVVKDGEVTLPSQQIKEESVINLDWRKKVIFQGELPPLSIKRFSAYLEKRPVNKDGFENRFIFESDNKYVEIDTSTGLLSSYRIDGVEYIKNGFELFSFRDNEDPWAMSGFQKIRLGDCPEPFTLSKKPSGTFEGMKSIQVIENGDIYLGVEAFFENKNSKARVEYIIYKNSADVDVNVTLLFGDINEIVKIAVPVCNGEEALGQAPFGTEELYGDGRENVSQRFVAIKKNDKYLTVLNNCLYGSHYENGTLYLSLVRGTTYCAHPIMDREIVPKNRYTKKMEQGEHNFSFRLTVSKREELERKATEFNRKPYVVNVFPLGENENGKDFDFQLSNKNITLVALKKSEEKEGYVFRLINNFGEEQNTKIKINAIEADAVFGKYEVKCFIFDGEKIEVSQEFII